VRESSAYWVKASAIRKGSGPGSTPAEASAAAPAVTKVASTAWSAKPPKGVTSP
jgi:hypothetical protein